MSALAPSPVILGPCTLYCGDAADFAADLQLDGVVTDPPYGIGADRHCGPREHGWVDYGNEGWDDEPAAQDVLNLITARNHRVAMRRVTHDPHQNIKETKECPKTTFLRRSTSMFGSV